jgi:meiotically up-regulated gene 157 (Mug157) protein
MCTQTLWHTVETTTIVLPQGETFIHTGDIDDLWLRDSAAQVHPLLIPAFEDGSGGRRQSLIELDPRLDRIVSGLIKRTSMYIRHGTFV